MIKLPRLTPLVHLVDPKTGISTRQGADFWNQAMTRIEAALSGVQQGDVTIGDTLHIGENLTLSADGTLSAEGSGLSIDIANSGGVVVHEADQLRFLGDATITARSGSEADAYFPPLQVDGYDMVGDALTFSTIHDISMEGNAYLSSAGMVTQRGIATQNSSFTAAAQVGSALLYFQLDTKNWNPPIPITQVDSLNGAHSYFGTFSTAEVVLISPSSENDAIAAILTDPATLAEHYAGTLNSGAASSTISLPVSPGRLYVAIADHDVTIPITSQSNIAFDTSVVSTMSSSTAPHPTGVLLATDILDADTIDITISSSGTFSTNASYLALLIVPPDDQASDHVTITVPPLTVWNNGTEVSTNLHGLTAGNGITISGDANDATITGFLEIGGQLVEEVLALGSGLSISGTSPEGLTLANTGVLKLGSLAGTIALGTGLAESAGTLNNSGVLAISQGTLHESGTISIGSGLSLSGTALDGLTELEYGGTVVSLPTVSIGENLTLFSGTLSAASGGGSETIARNGTILTTAATEINFSGMTYGVSGGTVTIPDATSIAASGVVGVWNGGTLYPTLVAGSNITLTGSGDTLTASANGGGGASITYGLYGQGGTLVASPAPSTPKAFGPFTVSNCRFDTLTTLTIVPGHVYRIDVSFSVYAPLSGNGGNICIQDSSGTHGYFGAMANFNSGNQFQSIYSVAGSSFTSLEQGPNEKGNQQAQTYQLFFVATASGNILWSRSFSSLCGASTINTVANLLSGPLTFGYANNLTDVFTMKVYDMGAMA